jgi:hypothetical protein
MFTDYAILGQQTYNGSGRLNFTGLIPGNQYDVRVWTWVDRVARMRGDGTTWAAVDMDYDLLDDSYAVMTNLGTFAMSGPAPDGLEDYCISFTATATPGGKITLRQGVYNDGTEGAFETYYGWMGPLGVINGFTIEEHGAPVPEPATLLLVGTGALGVFGCIRRRMLK